MPETPTTYNYYPALSGLITSEDLPEILDFIKEGLQEAFDKVYYKDFQSSRNVSGSGAFYSLDIVSRGRLDLEFPGTGIFIILNPDYEDSTISSFPIQLYWEWEIMRFVRYFNANQFSFSVDGLYDLALQIFNVSEAQSLELATNTFVVSSTPGISKFQQLINDINALYGSSISIDENSETRYQQLVIEIDLISQQVFPTVFTLYLFSNDVQTAKNNLNYFFLTFIPADIESYIKDLILPKARATLELSAAIEFPRTMLIPVYDESGPTPYEPIPPTNPDAPVAEQEPKALFTFGEALFYADTEQGLGYNMDIVLNTNVPAQIGNTGLIIDIQNLKIDLSSTQNFIEADLQGLSPEFMGVYTDYTEITLPKKWFNNVDNTTLQIVGRNLLVGTGGVTGTIALETIGGQPNNGAAYMDLKIGDWKIGFNHFDITFKQNVIQQSHVVGKLTIPKLKKADNTEAVIDIVGHLNEVGDFNLTASVVGGVEYTLFNFVTFNFLTLELGRENDDFYIGTSCQIWFENQTMAKLIGDQIIEIPKLRVYDNGTIEIVGGTGFLPLSISLDLGPVEMAVTGVHYGTTQLEHNGNMRKYSYWGFDGAISLDPLGIDVRGDGIKYYYTTDNDEFGDNGDSFIHIKTLEIDLVIPGTASPDTAIALIHGMLSIPEPGESSEYIGEISLKIPKAKIAGGASMRLQPKYPAFIVDAAIDLPAPIPLGPLGVYGFKGLLGYNYVATKQAVGLSSDDRWYDYYTAPPRGIHTSKFIEPPESLDYTAPIALGAGAVLGTSFDNGSILSARVMMVLSLPSLFMLDGKASILSSRLGLDSADEPPFFAFIAWGDSSIEMGIGADYQLPKDKGWILELYAEVQAGFNFNAPQSWYINFGTQQAPVRAKVLTLVTAQTFLMLSAQGIQAGARAEIDIRKRFGPAKVHLYAYLEIGGQISFERPQMGGYIGAGGKIEVDIWIVGLSLGLDALFAVEAAQPFLIYAELRIRPCVKIAFVRICKSFTIKLKWEKDATVNRTPISPMSQAKQTELAKGIHMLTHQSFDLNSFTTPPTVSQIDKVIPLDTYIEFKTEKGLLPGAITNTIGGYTFAPENFVDLVPPKKTVRGGKQIRQVKHRYSIEAIEVKAWNGTTWVDYHPFEAIVAPDNRPEVANLKTGYWQIKEKQYDTIRLLATTPFTYLEAGEPGWHKPEVYGMTASTLYCEETTKKEDCSNMLLQDLGQKMRMPDGYLGHYIQKVYYSISQDSGYEIVNGQVLAIEEDYMEITNAINPHGFAQSLTFRNGNSLIIYLPEDAVQVKLWLTTYSRGVTIKYYATGINDQRSQVAHYLVQEEYKTAGQLQSAIEYENVSQAIIKIVIDPDQSDIERIQDIEEQIAQLFQDTYEDLSGIVNITEPKDRNQYEKLIGELDTLKNIGCTAVDSDCKKDEMLCALYDKLLDLFESCFIYPVSEDSIWELLDQVDCFNLFYNLIFNFNTDHPEYHLLESMGELYTYFDDTWRQLEEMMGHYPEIPAGEIIAQYYYFRELSIEVMDFILKLGECDCDDKPKQVCTTSLQQVCWLSMEKHQWNETLPGAAAIEADFEAMTDAVEKEAQPIWRPNTPYYIKCLLKDEVDNGESTPGQFSLYYGFKTVGPLGHYHKNPASNYVPSGASPDAYPLSSLRAYVDEKRSFPNINGNLLKAKPLFYGNEQCKISVFFNTPLAEHMFQKWHSYQNMTEWEGQLHIAIKDPITNVIIPYPLPANYFERSVPVADADGYQWVVDQHPQLPPHIQLINNLIENGDLPCRIDLGQAIKPRSRSFQVTLTNLMPQKLYTALLYNAFGTTEDLVSELVHDFVFQTSRYKNFSEQINSYIIEDEETTIQKQAVYSLSIALTTAQITKVFAIIANPNNQTNDYPLANIYQDLFDRIWEGVLQIPPQDAAERTEFVRIKNTHTQEVIAIWIRNPEPFNNPKIPLDQIADMIQIVTVIGNPENEYKIIYSKDYSQALVMHSSLSIQASSLGFKFNYYNWNGNAYEIEDTVQVSDISIS